MAVDRSRTVNQALVIHDPRISMDTFDATNSTVTQTGPHAGVPEPSVVTQMALQATGEQTEAITVFTAEPGKDTATWGWRDSDNNDYYWDGPTTLRQARFALTPVTTSTNITGLMTSSVLYKGDIYTTFPTFTGETSKIYYGDIFIYKISNVETIENSLGFAYHSILNHPDGAAFNSTPRTFPISCLCVMPNGKLHLYTMNRSFEPASGSYYLSVDLYVFDDVLDEFILQKSTVALTGRKAYRLVGALSVGVYPVNLTVAAVDGSCLMIIDCVDTDNTVAYRNLSLQLASTDGGFTFEQITDYAATAAEELDLGVKHRAIGLPNKQFLVTYIACSAVGDGEYLYYKKLRSAITNMEDTPGTMIDIGGGFNSGFGSTSGLGYYRNADIDITISKDGNIYCYYKNIYDQSISDEAVIGMVVSTDYGDTWTVTQNSLNTGNTGTFRQTVYNPRNADDSYINTFSVSAVGGSVYLQGCLNTTSSIPFYDNTVGEIGIVSLELGGWTTLARPFLDTPIDVVKQTAFDYNYLPYSLPNEEGWSASGIGSTNTIVLSGDLLYLQTVTGLNARIYEHSWFSFRTMEHSLSLFDVEVDSGAADLELYQSDTTFGYSSAWRVRVSATQLLVSSLDMAGTVVGANVISQALPNPGGRHQVYIGISPDAGTAGNSAILVGIRAHDPTSDREFVWTEYTASATGLTLDSFTKVNYRVTSFSTVKLYSIQFGFGSKGAYQNKTIDTPAAGRFFRTTPIYAGKNVSISAYGGPTYIGDEWVIEPVYDYGLANLFEEGSPSPNVPWRATDDSEQNIIFRLSDYGDDASMMSKAMGVFFYNANFEKAEIYGSNTSGAGAWTLLDTIESHSGFEELSWIRKGDVIRPPAEDLSPSMPYMPMNALIGSTFYDNAEDASGKILANTEGVWIEGDLNVTPRIKIGTVSDPISAEEAGEGYIWVKDFGAIINNLADYEYIRIRIPACTTADGYISLGALVVGNVHYLGRRHGRQRTMSRDANVQTTTLRSGAKRTRVLGPTRRELTFSWANENEIDETQLYASFVDPDYITIGNIPQNTVAGTGKLIEGIIEELQGEHGLVTYVSNVPSNGSIKPFSFLRGRIVSSYNEDVVLGNEMDNELKRVSSVTISEEV